jgi:hypothetical protein
MTMIVFIAVIVSTMCMLSCGKDLHSSIVSTVYTGPVYYIDPSATSSGNGSLAAPYNTLADVVFEPGKT